MVVALEPVTAADATWMADVLTAWRPDEPTDAIRLRHQWARRCSGWVDERFAVKVDQRVAGLCACSRPAEPAQPSVLDVRLIHEHSRAAGAVIDQLEGRHGRPGPSLIECYDDEAELLHALRCRAYRVDRRHQLWELNLVQHRDRLRVISAASLAASVEVGARVTSLAAAGDVWEQLTALWNDAVRDVPGQGAHRDSTVGEVRDMLASTDASPERVWLAMRDREAIGLSFLLYPPARGHVWTGFTACARRFRGLGIARAVKLATIAQALELSVPCIRTRNDAGNAPILHLNQTLGYRPITGRVTLIKRSG